jgi:hypothetical protein
MKRRYSCCSTVALDVTTRSILEWPGAGFNLRSLYLDGSKIGKVTGDVTCSEVQLGQSDILSSIAFPHGELVHAA